MNDFTIKNILEKAWGTTKENFGFLIGFSVIIFVGGTLLGAVAVVPIVGFLATLAVQIAVKMGVVRMFLSLIRGKKLPYTDLITLWKPFWVFFGASLVMGIVVTVGTIFFIIPGIIAAIALQFYVYEIVDKNKGAIESLKSSAALTRGHRWNLLGLMLVLGLINVAGALVFGIGLIITMPLTGLAVTYAYEILKKPTEAVDAPNVSPAVEGLPSSV